MVTESARKSFSRETTFEHDLHPRLDKPELSRQFTRLCEQVAEDLRGRGYVGATIGIKLRFEDFQTVTRDHTLDTPTADPALIRRIAGECARRIPLDKRIRLLGVRVGKLSAPVAAPAPETARQARLFDD